MLHFPKSSPLIEQVQEFHFVYRLGAIGHVPVGSQKIERRLRGSILLMQQLLGVKEKEAVHLFWAGRAGTASLGFEG